MILVELANILLHCFDSNFCFLNIGGVFATLMPKKEYFHKALYTIDIGHNDLGGGFYRGMTIQQVTADVPEIVKIFKINVKVGHYPFLFN